MPRRWPRCRPGERLPTLADIGFEPTNLRQLKLPSGPAGGHELLDDFLDRIDRYHETRDFPAVKGPSYLSTHLRFGTVSIRRLARAAHAAHGGGLARRRGLAVRADLARLLPPGAAPPPARGRRRLQARVRPHPLGTRQARRRAVRRLVRRPHRLPAGGRGDAPDQPDRLHAQPAAHGGGELPDQGPGPRLAPRRGLLRAPPERLRPGGQQRRLAMGGVDRLRRAAVLPHLQPGEPEREVRRRRPLHPPLPAAAGRAAGQADPRARGWRGRWTWPRPGWNSARTTRCRWCSTTKRARRRWRATRW